MANAVKVKDVAQRAGVSIGTVSRVLNNHENVNEQLRARVLKAATELGYFRQPTATPSPQSAPSSLSEIGFLHASLAVEITPHPFWAHILHGAEKEATTINARVTYRNIHNLGTNPYTQLTKIHDMRLDGILLVGPAEPEVIAAIHNTNIPLVLVDNYSVQYSTDAILSDNFGSVQNAVSYLLEQGHRNIAFIGGPTLPNQPWRNKIYTIEMRAAAYRNALYLANINPVLDLQETSDLTPEGGYEACMRLIQAKKQFTAIFCANDQVAMGAMRALRESNIRVPEDVSLIGFDDFMAEHLTPALTTIHVNTEAMGISAIRSLVQRVKDPHAARTTITIPANLIKRDSVSTALI